MDRISSMGIFTLAMANIADTQQRQITAARQVSSQKVAQDLKGYAGKAETLTAMKSAQAKFQGFVDQNALLQDRFTTQDTALGQLADSVAGVRQAITDALASGSVDTLMQEARGYFTDATAALNTKSQGRYLFAGGQVNTQPVSATSMSDLTHGTTASFFHNDQFVATNQIDETSSIQAGMLADGLGTDVFNAFKDIQAFQEGGSGPFSGKMTDAQRTFLEGMVSRLDDAHEDVVNANARNGATLKRLEGTDTDLNNRLDMMGNLVGKITDVDMADAVSRLQSAQIAVQASAEVFNTLRNSSLLNYLQN